MTTLRVMTYNVRALKDDREALARVVASADPDVLLVQEVPRHPLSDHRVAAFAESLGMVWGGGARHRMSTTLFTAPRVDVHDCGHGLYDVPRPQEPRGFGWAHVSKGGSERIVVASTHMTLYTEQRKPHVQALLADPHVATGDPIVVGGDFNEQIDEPAVQEILRSLADVGSPAWTSPADGSEKRIDFIFASPELTVHPVDLVAEEADLLAATDHRPVIVDVEVPARP